MFLESDHEHDVAPSWRVDLPEGHSLHLGASWSNLSVYLPGLHTLQPCAACFELLPAGQALHFVELLLSVYRPGLHAVHFSCPLKANLPFGHA